MHAEPPRQPGARRHLLPRTRAYREIWLEGEKIAGGEAEDEPIYGRTYLPRKFKTVVAVPPDNDVDVFAHDLGFTAVVGEDGGIQQQVPPGLGPGAPGFEQFEEDLADCTEEAGMEAPGEGGTTSEGGDGSEGEA